MAKARKILKRVKAVKNIHTVTKTMEMVATSRFKKAHRLIPQVRLYTSRLTDMVADLVARSGDSVEHPLIRSHSDRERDLLFVMTSNRGLCGAYNASVLRVATERLKQLREAGHEVELHVSGKRGIHFFRFQGYSLEKSYTDFDVRPGTAGPDYKAVNDLGETIMEAFLAGRISGVEIIYTQYAPSGRLRPVVAQVLPLGQLEPPPSDVPRKAPPIYEFLPSPREVLDRLLPMSVRMKFYQCFLDSLVSEQFSRMTAMRAASENAEEMIHDLTIRYNRTRQSQITTELSEIMGGRAGIEA